jgi:hypothetical protein
VEGMETGPIKRERGFGEFHSVRGLILEPLFEQTLLQSYGYSEPKIEAPGTRESAAPEC